MREKRKSHPFISEAIIFCPRGAVSPSPSPSVLLLSARKGRPFCRGQFPKGPFRNFVHSSTGCETPHFYFVSAGTISAEINRNTCPLSVPLTANSSQFSLPMVLKEPLMGWRCEPATSTSGIGAGLKKNLPPVKSWMPIRVRTKNPLNRHPFQWWPDCTRRRDE